MAHVYITAIYTRVNGDMQKMTLLKQQESWTVILATHHQTIHNLSNDTILNDFDPDFKVTTFFNIEYLRHDMI